MAIAGKRVLSVSVQALLWAHQLRIGLSPFQKLTLLVLAEHADERGQNSWPSVATIAREAELSERTVQRALQELVGRRVVSAIVGGGRARTTIYAVDMSLRSIEPGSTANRDKRCQHDTLSGSEKGANVTPFPAKRVSATTERVSATTEKGVSVTPEPVLNLYRTKEEDDDLGEAGPDGPTGRDDAAVALRLWNEFAGAAGLSRASHLTEKRRKALGQRLHECGGIEGWRIALEKVGESSFLLGKVKAWRAGFDFLLQPDSFARVMEGHYADRASAPPAPSGKETLRAVGDKLRERMGEDEWATI